MNEWICEWTPVQFLGIDYKFYVNKIYYWNKMLKVLKLYSGNITVYELQIFMIVNKSNIYPNGKIGQSRLAK